MSVLIRQMRQEDVPAAAAIIEAHCAFDGRCARKYYQEYFDRAGASGAPRECNFVAEDTANNEVLGVSGYTPDKYGTPGIWWLNWTYVRGDSRRRGIGTQLLQRVVREVQELGARKLYIDTDSDPSYGDAIRLYTRHGFAVEARLTDYYDDDEDFVVLARDFRQGGKR